MLTDVISRLTTPARADDTVMSFGPRRGVFINAADRIAEEGEPLDEAASIIARRSISFTARFAR